MIHFIYTSRSLSGRSSPIKKNAIIVGKKYFNHVHISCSRCAFVRSADQIKIKVLD